MSTIIEEKKISEMTGRELKEIIRDAVKEEILKIQISQTPYVSDEEMKDIEKSLTDDDLNDNNFVDMTEWLGK